MRLIRTSDIHKLPEGNYYSEGIKERHGISNFAKEAAVKELFHLGLHINKEYETVAEVLYTLEKYRREDAGEPQISPDNKLKVEEPNQVHIEELPASATTLDLPPVAVSLETESLSTSDLSYVGKYETAPLSLEGRDKSNDAVMSNESNDTEETLIKAQDESKVDESKSTSVKRKKA